MEMPRLSNTTTKEPVKRALPRRSEEPPQGAALASGPAEFVENLEIEVLGSGRLWRSGESAGFTDPAEPQPASGNVDAASVVTFVDGLSGAQKEDVLNSTLLAQLAANRKHDREQDAGGWYDVYRTVLEQVGWVSQPAGPKDRALAGRSLSRDLGVHPGPLLPPLPRPRPVFAYPFNPVVTNEVRFTPEAAVSRLLKTVASEAQVVVTKTSLDVFRRLPDRDRRVIIFETSSHTSAGGNFQIVTVRLSPKKVVLMTIAAYFFRTDEPVTRVLSFNFAQRATQMFQAAHIMALNEAAYSKARRRVIEQLGDQAAAFIDDLQI